MEAAEQEELADVPLPRKVSAGLLRGPGPAPPRKKISVRYPSFPNHSGSEQSEVTHKDGSSSGLVLDPPTLDVGVARASSHGEVDGNENAVWLASNALRRLQHVYYMMILRMLGFGFASAVDACNLSRSDGRMHGSHGSIVAVLQKCRLLARGVHGITGRACAADTKDARALPVLAFDLACSGHDKHKVTRTRFTTRRIPAQMAEPIYSLPKAMSNLLVLDLSGCSGLAMLPASLGTLKNLVALNLSCCYSLHLLPASLGTLQNLQILLLSCCHKLRNLPVSLCQLSMLRLLDLFGCSSLEVLPDSFANLGRLEILNLSNCSRLKKLPRPFGSLQELKYLNLSNCSGLDLDVKYLRRLANLKCLTLSPVTGFQSFPRSFGYIAVCLERSRWWKSSQIHPQCNPKVGSLHSYRCDEQSIIDMLLSDGSDEGDITHQIVTSICIVGESGMGKTELVHGIYNDQMILDAFNLRIWVYMCDKKRLLEKIAEFTTCAYCSNAPISVLEEIVMEELSGKRLLLVLDDSDIENHYFWGDVRKLLSVCAKGSALIVTTKSNDVAKLVGAMQTFYLSPLSKEECFMIFKGHVLGGLDMNSYSELESIGWKVVEKSGGNPLCIKALSGLNECFRSEEPFCSLAENICHLSLVPSDFKTVALAKEARNLQSFLLVRGSFPFVRILHSDDLYMKFGLLRALNLSYTDILELPRSIGNMKHLRLLALNNTKIKGLPFEIGQVGTLQTLELKDCCHLTDLPQSTSNLAKLRHLDVQKEPGNIKVGMPHGIGWLTDLQTLTEFNIGNNLSQCSIAEFKNLNGLRGHVHVTGLENIKTADDTREANIVGKHFLEALTLEWCYNDEDIDDGLCQEIANNILQNLQPNRNLQKLAVQNYPGNLFPLWMQDSYLSKLVSITLDNCYGCSKLPYLGDLPSLKSLFIQRMNSIESFAMGSNSLVTEEKRPPRFPSLEVLTLWEMYDLQFWDGTSEGDFPRICRLSISRCPRLTNLPPLRSLVHLSVHCSSQVPSFSELPSLESLKVEGFNKIRSISFPHQLTTLKKLEITDCKELSSMYAYTLSVSDLRVVRCPKLDLVGSSLEDHHRQKVDGGRKSPTRSSMVLKAATHTSLQDDGWKWEKHGENNILGSNIASCQPSPSAPSTSLHRCRHCHCYRMSLGHSTAKPFIPIWLAMAVPTLQALYGTSGSGAELRLVIGVTDPDEF
ncbi:NBS-LRR-like resistance protein [Panicum miliaceum]|uniref:NBS-LRR-like resistance protein n=1 Tax=Panicum miliaceum TaxID=4540 RepID=A0A3L6TAC9_PANMI|nr:NBS-LRR-like resistance protein [Panicum miliaceum]